MLSVGVYECGLLSGCVCMCVMYGCVSIVFALLWFFLPGFFAVCVSSWFLVSTWCAGFSSSILFIGWFISVVPCNGFFFDVLCVSFFGCSLCPLVCSVFPVCILYLVSLSLAFIVFS